MKEMVGGCCVCSDSRGWPENPLVYCDGHHCSVAVHQACYGIVTVPAGPWFCRKCESQERPARVKCELCPSRDGALKRTDNQGWAHVVCALYIPEVRFGNVTTMEPIILQLIPPERYNKYCYICHEAGKEGKANVGACMQCNKSGCKSQFHVTCAQQLGLLCEEAGNYLDNVKYCGYCQHHYSKLKKGGNVKPIPPYKPVAHESSDSPSSPEKEPEIIHPPLARSSNRAIDPLAPSTTTSASTSSSSKPRKSSSASKSNSVGQHSSSGSTAHSSSSNPQTNAVTTSSRTSASSSSIKEKDKHSDKDKEKSEKDGKHSKSTKSHDKDSSSSASSSYSSYSRDKNSKSSKSSNSSSNKDATDSVLSLSGHKSESKSQLSSTTTSSTTIRITTSSATSTSPPVTIIQKGIKDEPVKDSKDGVISMHVNAPHTNSSKEHSAPKIAPSSFTSVVVVAESTAFVKEGSCESSKANYSAMTKKRKALHQANSSTTARVVEENNQISHKDLCKDFSVTLTPLQDVEKFETADFERHFKKARTEPRAEVAVTSASTSTVTTTTPAEPNIQNVSPNVIKSTNASISSNSPVVSAPIVTIPTSSISINKQQVITQNVSTKLSAGAVKEQQPESLVVSVPLSATVPGINLPTTTNNSSTTIVSAHQTSMPPAQPTSLYQHLTNNTSNHRASPLIQHHNLIQQHHAGRQSPLRSIGQLERSSTNVGNHSHVSQTSVLQSSSSSSVINSMPVTHNTVHPSTETTSATGMVKISYDKQVGSRIAALQQDESISNSRRSRSQSNDGNRGSKPAKKRATASPNTSTTRSQSSHSQGPPKKASPAVNHSTKSPIRLSNKKNSNSDSTSAGSLPVPGNPIISSGHLTATSVAPPPTVVQQPTATQAKIVVPSGIPQHVISVPAKKSRSHTNDTHPPSSASSRTPELSFSNSSNNAFGAISHAGAGPGLKFGYEPQQPAAPLTINTSSSMQNLMQQTIKESPPSSPGSEASARKRSRKSLTTVVIPSPQLPSPNLPNHHIIGATAAELKETKQLPNGVMSTHHMLGNQLNLSSNVAQKMTDTLNNEMEAHSIYHQDAPTSHIGPMYPGKRIDAANKAMSSATTSSGPASLTSMLSGTSNGVPQSLEQLLERQWEQGSQFLMEQAQHFDIASLLSCLHQLKIENSKLEDHINSLVSRRDHLLAVNARLAIPLGQSAAAGQGATHLSNVTHPNGPAEPSTSQAQSSSSAPQTSSKNSRIAISYITNHGALENGLDYRHNAPATSSSNVRHSSPAIPAYVSSMKQTSHEQANAQSQSSQPAHHSNVQQFQPNPHHFLQHQAQAQAQQQSSNAVGRIRSTGNSYQAQQQANYSTGHHNITKTKN